MTSRAISASKNSEEKSTKKCVIFQRNKKKSVRKKVKNDKLLPLFTPLPTLFFSGITLCTGFPLGPSAKTRKRALDFSPSFSFSLWLHRESNDSDRMTKKKKFLPKTYKPRKGQSQEVTRYYSPVRGSSGKGARALFLSRILLSPAAAGGVTHSVLWEYQGAPGTPSVYLYCSCSAKRATKPRRGRERE